MKLCQVLRNAAKFRPVFDFGERDVAHWFPGHMAKGDSFAQSYRQNMVNKCNKNIHICVTQIVLFVT